MLSSWTLSAARCRMSGCWPLSHSCGLDLFPGVIAGTHERAGLDVLKAHRHPDVAHVAEFVGSHVAVDWNVVGRGTQILAERENVDVDGAQVAHDELDFLEGLAHAKDDARLGRNVRRDPLGRAENLHHALVATAGTATLVEARDGFRVVVVDVGSRLEDRAD